MRTTRRRALKLGSAMTAGLGLAGWVKPNLRGLGAASALAVSGAPFTLPIIDPGPASPITLTVLQLAGLDQSILDALDNVSVPAVIGAVPGLTIVREISQAFNYHINRVLILPTTGGGGQGFDVAPAGATPPIPLFIDPGLNRVFAIGTITENGGHTLSIKTFRTVPTANGFFEDTNGASLTIPAPANLGALDPGDHRLYIGIPSLGLLILRGDTDPLTPVRVFDWSVSGIHHDPNSGLTYVKGVDSGGDFVRAF